MMMMRGTELELSGKLLPAAGLDFEPRFGFRNSRLTCLSSAKVMAKWGSVMLAAKTTERGTAACGAGGGERNVQL